MIPFKHPVGETMTYRLAAAILALVFAAGPALAAAKPPSYVAAALADPGRKDDEKKADAERKPAQMIAFAGIKPGAKVMDLMPGGGYFTHIFAAVVGPKGYVYAYVPSEINAAIQKRFPGSDPKKQFASYANVSVLNAPIATIVAPESLDAVWTSQNYHDFHNRLFGPADIGAMNRAIFAALKPGGVYIVLDHSAKAGSGTADTETLHRIDEAAVKQEVEAAGFKLAGESNVLRNKDDPRDKIVFDPSIRHHTDQFILKFVKPKR
jgi:predicted methyltransferase